MTVTVGNKMLECEARHWLGWIDRECQKIMNDQEGVIHAWQVETVSKVFMERIIKKRGREAANKLFREMVNQWEVRRADVNMRSVVATRKVIVTENQFGPVRAAPGGEKSLIDTLGSADT